MFELDGKKIEKGDFRKRLSEFRQKYMTGPVFATIVMVIITVVLAAILYVIVIGTP